MPAVPLLIAAAVGGTAAAGISAITAATQKKASTLPTATPDASQTVGGGTNTTANANNAGRAALISTSPSGVQGIDPTGRRKLIGND